LEFADNSQGNVMLTHDYVFLLADFDPTRTQEDGIVLKAGEDFQFTNLSFSYQSDQRKKFFYLIKPNVGSFYSGSRIGLEGSFTYRYQPLGFMSVDYTVNRLILAKPFVASTIWRAGPRVDLTFTKSLFLTTFVQYNSQFENLNINARLQWRFRPVSDFYLVYTDNYLFDPFSQFSVRNRGFIAKLTYWL
jgi:hypothetical protein